MLTKQSPAQGELRMLNASPGALSEASLKALPRDVVTRISQLPGHLHYDSVYTDSGCVLRRPLSASHECFPSCSH